jgi:hypothetical protein
MAEQAQVYGMGYPLKRKKDARFTKGTYVDDVKLAGML